MALQNINISIRAYKSNTALRAEDFVSRLKISASDKIVKTSGGGIPGQSAYIDFLDDDLDEGSEAGDPHNLLEDKIQNCFQYMAEWISFRDSDVWLGFQKNGITVEVFVSAWIEQDQFDLYLPPILLTACAQNKIGIQIMTND